MKIGGNRLSLGLVVPSILFIAYFVFGVFIYKDYGVFWDEGIERSSGIVNTKEILLHINKNLPERLFGQKINDNIPSLQNYSNRYYGVVLQFPLMLSDYFNRDKQHMWEARHLFMFLLYFTSVLVFFFTIKRIFGSWVWGMIGSLFLILTPRFFAESFYNIKDIGFFSAFVIAFYFLVRFIENPSIKNTILFGVFVTFASAVRIIGLSLIPFGAVFIFAAFFKKKISLSRLVADCLLFAASATAFLILFYPASWRNPLHFFFNVIKQMSNYPWDGKILFMGRIYMAHDLPWYYAPVWIAVTTPIPVLAFMVIGVVLPFYRYVFGKRTAPTGLSMFSWVFSIVLFLGMILYVIIRRSTLYDGWRHLYFLYLPILILAIFGVKSLYEIVMNYAKSHPRLWRSVFYALLGLTFLPSLVFIFEAHPYQNVYFNAIAGRRAFYLFEKDYWCLSYVEALNLLATRDTSNKIYVLNTGPMLESSEMLDKSDRDRIVLTGDAQQAEYSLDTFRAAPYDPQVPNELFSIKVEGQKILSVIKLRN